MTIRQLNENETPPWELLLDADPSREMIDRYLPQSEVHVLENDGEVLGVVVLTPMGDGLWEIKNIAVDDDHQGKGLGKKLIAHAVARARAQGATTLRIGTGSTGVVQLALYQKAGFRMVRVDRDFFTRNPYPPLEENGLPVRDMVILEMVL